MKKTEAESIDSQNIHENAEASHKVFSKGHERETKEDCAMDPYEEKIAESHRVTLPDLVESEEETDSESEIEQEYSMGTARYQTCDTDNALEEEKLNNFQPSGEASSCMEKTEVEYIDNQYIHDNGEAPHKVSGKAIKKKQRKNV